MSPSKPRLSHRQDFGSNNLGRPQGAPRGFLVYYILHRISLKPLYGYEILQDIDSKTEGAWRPGPGSVYPILKKLVSKGYIKSESVSGGETSQHSYHITPKGATYLQEAREMFSTVGQRWSAMRRIFIDMMGPEHLAKFLIDGTKQQFQTAQEMLKSKMNAIARTEAEYIMKEYALNLERQLDWANQILKEMQKGKLQEQPLRKTA